MPDLGMYKKKPRPESVEKLIQCLESSKAVESIKHVREQVLHIERSWGCPLVVYMTNIYIIGESDVYEIIGEEKKVGAIVTMSAWNGYTSGAKNLCKDEKIGLFKFRELLGAIYYEGDKFLNYIHPEDRR